MGGVTQSMLGDWIFCRERARVKYIEGLRSHNTFNHRIEYGSMWHLLEECHASPEHEGRDGKVELRDYCKELCQQYPTQQTEIQKWYNVVLVQFPIYAEWWAKHPDVVDRTPLLQEHVFKVPYKLPSGRTVWLRGKFDSVDLVGKRDKAGIWLQENKSKSDIDQAQLQRQLLFDMQTMLYLVALTEMDWDADRGKDGASVANGGFLASKGGVAVRSMIGGKQKCTVYPVRGVRYNVIRRPLSGGTGSIVRHKPSKKNPAGETEKEYYARLGTIIKESHGPSFGLPEGQHHFFARWKVDVTPTDIERFKKRFLDPVLSQLCDWYECVTSCSGDPFEFCNKHRGLHFQFPFGTYNPLTDGGGSTDLDEYINSGNSAGLTKVNVLFSELK